jgi:hypothetical protein
MNPWLETTLGPVLDRLPFLRGRRRAADWRQVLGAVPVRNRLLEWTEEPEGVVLRVPLRREGFFRWINRIMPAPEHRKVVLDEIGSDVWRMCDGETPVEGIIRALAKKYQLNRREVELSLSLYLKQLARRGYLGLVAAEPPPAATPAAKDVDRPKNGQRKKRRCRQKGRSGSAQHPSG